ncbi:hypothetical protein PILCRDRAFT_471921 [Piloderma croceum F 1598]|uniref:Uncharacterized protein n=1 Tax=Piloderma croceum (strain F 1598) TaxID=765440 RepID=A0A0C3FR95_PILCF|nr:hypothetical protein PILCRDRAFT_471921 [Piloderma croceum F 1598]
MNARCSSSSCSTCSGSFYSEEDVHLHMTDRASGVFIEKVCKATHSPILAEDFEFYDLDASFLMSSNYDREDLSYKSISRDVAGGPVPSVMLTLPTPEIPTSLRFDPQSPFTVPEFVSANSSITKFSAHKHDVFPDSDRITKDLPGFKQASFQEPFVRRETPNVDNGVTTGLMNVSAWSTNGLGIDVEAGSSEVAAGNEKVESKTSLLGALAKYSPAEDDACTGQKDEDAEVPLDKAEPKARTRKHMPLWTKFRKLFEVSVRRRL